MSARFRIRLRRSAMSVSRAVFTRASSAMTNTSVKNRSTTGRSAGDIGERLAIVRRARRLLDPRPARVELGEERQLGGLGERRAVERRVRLELARDVLDALEEHGERLEVLGAAHAAAARPPRAGRASGTTSLPPRDRAAHDLVRVAALLECVAQALLTERDDGIVHGGAPAPAETARSPPRPDRAGRARDRSRSAPAGP